MGCQAYRTSESVRKCPKFQRISAWRVTASRRTKAD
jgi:hypothetical protein